MSSEAPEKTSSGPRPPKKSKLGIVLAIVVVVVLVAGAAVAGTLLGPELLGGSKKPEAAAEKKEAAHAGKIGETTELNPILVDIRSEDATLHHLKVVLSIELEESTPKAEFMKYAPRGREATIAYLRSQPFEVVAAPDRY